MLSNIEAKSSPTVKIAKDYSNLLSKEVS